MEPGYKWGFISLISLAVAYTSSLPISVDPDFAAVPPLQPVSNAAKSIAADNRITLLLLIEIPPGYDHFFSKFTALLLEISLQIIFISSSKLWMINASNSDSPFSASTAATTLVS
ncbi:hypothetical protein D3C77_491740 [compost metagenome]